MGWRRLASACGQTQGEFALVVAGVAIACVVGVLFLGGAVGDLWERSSKPVTPNTFNPPVVAWPRARSDCEDPNWKTNFPQFATQQDCLDFVADITR